MFDSECYCTTYVEKATRNAPPPRAASLQPNPWCGAAIARLALATLARPAQPEKKGGAWKANQQMIRPASLRLDLYWEEHLNWKERGRRKKKTKAVEVPPRRIFCPIWRSPAAHHKVISEILMRGSCSYYPRQACLSNGGRSSMTLGEITANPPVVACLLHFARSCQILSQNYLAMPVLGHRCSMYRSGVPAAVDKVCRRPKIICFSLSCRRDFPGAHSDLYLYDSAGAVIFINLSSNQSPH